MIIHISVRNLVEFLMQSGDIDNRIQQVDPEAMQLGIRAHRRIQKSMGPTYKAEVPLSETIDFGEFALEVEGRADGIICESSDIYTVDEIKGIFQDLNKLEEPKPVHLAQAKVYGAILAKEKDLPEIGIRMTYVNLDTDEVKCFESRFEKEELRSWFEELIDSYRPWAKFSFEWRKKRTESAAALEFPFEYREGQKDLVVNIYRTILRGKKMFLQAPTGVGKTIAAVFPGVKAMGEGLIDKFFYLTPRTTTQQVALKTCRILKEQGLSLKVLVITAKDKICLCESRECNPEYCEVAKGHYDRILGALYDILTGEDVADRETIIRYALKHRVCPFELSLDLSLWADGVICDYNYLFDPNAHLRRFFSDTVKEKYLFLIDEAHNLVDRGRDMYSGTLVKEDFLEVRRLIKDKRPRLEKRLSRCNSDLLKLKKAAGDAQVCKLDFIGDLELHMINLMSELDGYLEDTRNRPDEIREGVLDFYFKLRRFMTIYELCDENYIIYTKSQGGEFSLNLLCANPAANLNNYLSKGVATIFFSATFLPINYYKSLLSTAGDDYAVYAHSPFDPGKRLVLIGEEVTTRFTRRGQKTYQDFAEYVIRGMKGRKGKYMAFFPSYDFLGNVEAAIRDKLSESKEEAPEVISQSQAMSEREKDEFVERFTGGGEESLLGLCVMGAGFSEGIDLTGDSLIGAFIAGTGLPQICTERELIKEYFDSRDMDGFAFAYLFAGMNKVLQAAGRVIRTGEDRGIIVLLDDRFRRADHRRLFPREWTDIERITIDEIEARAGKFWEDQG